MIDAIQAILAQIPWLGELAAVKTSRWLGKGWSTDTNHGSEPIECRGGPLLYNVTPDTSAHPGHLYGGQSLLMAMTTQTPRVAVVNPEFAKQDTGLHNPGRSGRYSKMRENALRVVGRSNGKYKNLTEDQHRDVPPLRNRRLVGHGCGALEPRPAGTCRGHGSVLRTSTWDGSGNSPVEHRTGGILSLAYGDSIAGCAGVREHAVDYRHLRNGGILGETSGCGSWEFASPGASATEVLQAAWDGRSTCCDWFGGWIGFWSACDEGDGFHCVSATRAIPGIDRYFRDGRSGLIATGFRRTRAVG